MVIPPKITVNLSIVPIENTDQFNIHIEFDPFLEDIDPNLLAMIASEMIIATAKGHGLERSIERVTNFVYAHKQNMIPGDEVRKQLDMDS